MKTLNAQIGRHKRPRCWNRSVTRTRRRIRDSISARAVALTEFPPAIQLLLSGPDAHTFIPALLTGLVDPEGAPATVAALTQRLGTRKHAILLRHALHG